MIHGDFPKNNNGSGLYEIYVVYYDQIDIKTTKNNFWDIVLVCRIERVNIKVVERKICSKITPVKISNFLIVFEL